MMRSAMVLVVGLCVLIFSALSSLASSGRVALVIGNSAYSRSKRFGTPEMTRLLSAQRFGEWVSR